MPSPIDINGSPVTVGSKVRLLSLSGQWLEDLPAEERFDVMSMVGEILIVEEIDEYGHPWVRKSWPNEAEGRCYSHSVALEQHEMEVVQNAL
jgi:hypothetical protein